MTVVRLLLCCLLWPPVLVVDLVVTLAGFIVVPILARRAPRNLREVASLADGLPIVTWRARWARYWGNLDEGLDPQREPTNPSGSRWWHRTRRWSLRRRIVSWAAFRNPTSGMRFTALAAELEPGRVMRDRGVEWVGNSPNPLQSMLDNPGPLYWCWARLGVRSGLWIIRGERTLLRLGWTVCPAPRREIDRYCWVKWQVWRRR